MDGSLRSVWAVKAIMVIIFTSILFRCVSATNHSVGGDLGWDLFSNLLIWTATTTFHVGDNLVFKYTPNHDVVELNQLDCAMCVLSNPIRAHDDGETVIHLTEPGTRYFVCGRLRHCAMGLKLQVQVLAQPNNETDDGDGDGDGVDGDQDQRRGGSGDGNKKSPHPRSPPPQHGGGDHDHIPNPPDAEKGKSPPSSEKSPAPAHSAAVRDGPMANTSFVKLWGMPLIILLAISLSSWSTPLYLVLSSLLHIYQYSLN
ncbi:Blue copper protein [Quillaja saponaria]|uniref:Blue copper protein n=1 Tax=Quillaja saponaria TaxID=32244 RepID=A0AAD7M584_QUISA|nr:Blue copper protein [Quillaja saponaria]